MTRILDMHTALERLGLADRFEPVPDTELLLEEVAEGAVRDSIGALILAVTASLGGAGEVPEPMVHGHQLIFSDLPDGCDIVVPGGDVQRHGALLTVTIGPDADCIGIVLDGQVDVITTDGRIGTARDATVSWDFAEGIDAAAALPALDGLAAGLVVPTELGPPPPLATDGSIWDAVAWAGAVYLHARPADTAGAVQAVLGGGDNPVTAACRTWAITWSDEATGQVVEELAMEIDALHQQLARIAEDHEVEAGELDAPRAFASDAARRRALGEAAERRDAIAGVCGLLDERSTDSAMAGALEALDHQGRIAVLGEADLANVPVRRRHALAASAPLSWWGRFA